MARRSELVEIQTRLGSRHIDTDKIITFPRGLMGFEDQHRFTLLQISENALFLMLQSVDNPDLGLLVGDPYTFLPEYRVKIGDAEQATLKVASAAELAVLVTVSIPPGKPEQTALNLTGPILINHEARIGLQAPQSDVNPPRVLLRLCTQPAPHSDNGVSTTDKAGDAQTAGGSDHKEQA